MSGGWGTDSWSVGDYSVTEMDRAVDEVDGVAVVGYEQAGDVALTTDVSQQTQDLWLRTESRLPVGSSASSRCGSAARARAMATRWRWPIES